MRQFPFQSFVILAVFYICVSCVKDTNAFSPLSGFSFLNRSFNNCSKNACVTTAHATKAANAILDSKETSSSSVKVYNTDDSSTVEVEHIGSNFIKPRLDDREYRAIRLTNSGLECLLVSDPLTDVESAAVHVKAGHFDDPADRAGLAHFHEHMLFLGTEKYPDENEYESFLGSHGGSSNAYTDMQDTNYYFSVQAPLSDEDDEEEIENGEEEEIDTVMSEGLKGALDRFAQFFIAPTFNEDMIEREMRAVDSEYKNSITSDSWRFYQTLKNGANPEHPFSKFGCGNYETLSTKPSPRDDLFAFWNKHYRGDNMKLCVVGRASLDALEQGVAETFGKLPSREPTVNCDNNDQISTNMHQSEKTFVKEHSQYGGVVAFGSEQLGKIREVIPVVETRAIQLYFATPPMDDPVLKETNPYRVISHLIGHESPGSLHALLLQEGFINDLTSGVGADTADFSLCSLTLSMTPKGMKNKEYVLDLVWQYLALIKKTVLDSNDGDEDDLMAKYHDEMRGLSRTNFEWRENGDPTDFCSAAAELLFEYEPEKVLLSSANTGPYNHTIAKAFLERFSPENCLITIVEPKKSLEATNGDTSNPLIQDGEINGENDDEKSNFNSWQTEPWYRAEFREVTISESLREKWSNSNQEIDERLKLPELNSFIPTNFSLRSDDNSDEDTTVDYSEIPPKLLALENVPGLTMWHKMDRTFKVPKTYIRLSITSPNVYASPRSMTYARLFQKVLEDDLNSFVYDATVAGCHYKVFCVPSGFRINLSGYSEKLPLLLDVVTSRILSIIEEMKEDSPSENSHLSLKFNKAVENLLRETKNFQFDSPYETAAYMTRMMLEDNVWHVKNYIAEMEGDFADKHPLTLQECASVVEQCLSKRLLVQSLCMGNIDEAGTLKVVDSIKEHFLADSRPLQHEEMPQLQSVKLPTREEAVQIFGEEVKSSPIPLVLEDVVVSESEENNAIEVILQAGSDHDLGYEGIATIELIGHIAYNSAFNQLRTKEQLGYIVSAFVKKTAGGAVSFAVIVQSSSTLPSVLEERVLNWLENFRQELQDMSPERISMEANAVVAQLLERNMRLSNEVSSRWREILATDPTSKRICNPAFDRLEKIAEELTVDDDEVVFMNEGEDVEKKKTKTAEELKQQILEFYDKYFTSDAPSRRAMSSRVYGHSAKTEYEKNKNKPGILSSYEDAREIKRFLAIWPTAPYWA